MKKVVAFLLALTILVFSASAAFADASYSNGKVHYTYDVDGVKDVKLDGKYINSVKGSGSATYTVELAPGTHTIEIGGSTYSFTIAAPTAVPTVEPTVEPTAVPTVEPTVEPTAVPTVEPTAVPTVEPTVEPTAVPTVEPTAVPTVEPTAVPTVTPASDDSDSDVPKTGDATTTFLFVIMAAMVLAAGALTAMRVCTRRK